ncbi:NAD(P)-dependent oxidoreductase [Pelagibius sp. CAU 1746]|uniref:NAD(P)-dependent oxidoreductase n=1 Tax=Pelagibius sp. CAU 1746 TaxID=3140370 RepID=UPI00325B0426
MGNQPDIRAGRLPESAYAENFGDVHPPLDRKAALIESSRCYFCYDAPCVEACPTGIDIPSFIRKISTDNVRGAAQDIFDENILGGACARVCPTEILCQQACVRNTQEAKPVQIGLLQRYATDAVMDTGDHPFSRAGRSGKTVAVVGAGPAGLACAHRLAVLGHDVVILEAKPKPGGLNEYGIAAYKVPDAFAQQEVDFVLQIGGIEIRNDQALGRDFTLADLRRDYDAVFLGMGLGGVRQLDLEGEDLEGVHNAVDYIAELRQSQDLKSLPVGRKVVVIGGGNTAIDIAVQSKRLGAEDVTLVYRRGPDAMSATDHEQEFAQVNGVKIKHWAQPREIRGMNGHITDVVFEYTQLDGGGRLAGTGDVFSLPVDMLFKAIGQTLLPQANGGSELLEMDGAKIAVNEARQTSLSGVWAGGDCVAISEDLTVAAVQDGKLAAEAINSFLRS